MTTNRTAIDRGRRARLTPELRAKAERFLALDEVHQEAIEAPGDDHPFYFDGRHGELCRLSSEVCRALGIRPWQDAAAIVEAALMEEAADAD